MGEALPGFDPASRLARPRESMDLPNLVPSGKGTHKVSGVNSTTETSGAH